MTSNDNSHAATPQAQTGVRDGPGHGGTGSDDYAIQLIDITKRFPGVVANDRVNLSVRRGEIHSICGENGAGKSTLMKILYGLIKPDEGTMLVNGNPVNFSSPTEAIESGIGMVFQHFMLADNLTVLENVILGDEPTKGLKIDFAAAEQHLAQVGKDYGLTLDPDTPVFELEVGEKQRIEIIKVLFRGAEILILDEPTAVLVPHEVEALFESMRELKAGGATILFIDHKLLEVLEISDRVTVLRQGQTIKTVDADDVTAAELAELMVGSELPSPETTESTVTERVVLNVDRVTVNEDGRAVVDDVSLSIHAGEVLGIAGVEGNGQNELVEAIVGTGPMDAGSISISVTDDHGKWTTHDITKWSVRKRRDTGIGYVPQDRHHEGLLLNAPLWENAALGHQTKRPFSRSGWFNRSGSRDRTKEIVAEFGVKTPGVEVVPAALSGGNQQKLIIGREMITAPPLLIAAHPTRGIDVGAQAAVWNDIRQARHDGLATLLISADLDELIGLSDTIMVMFHGRIVATLDPATITPRELGSYMTGAAGDSAHASNSTGGAPQ